MRTPGAILSIAGLFWGFLQAPFFHIHAGELEHEPVSIPVHLHSHLSPQASGVVLLAQTADDDDVETEWSVAQPQPVTILAEITAPVKTWLALPVFFSGVLPVPDQRGHDPPDLASTQPRSPPA